MRLVACYAKCAFLTVRRDLDAGAKLARVLPPPVGKVFSVKSVDVGPVFRNTRCEEDATAGPPTDPEILKHT